MKRKRWIALGLLVLIALGIAGALEMRARKWEGRWVTFVREWEAKGENFDPAAGLPPAMADHEEFAAHPWIRKIAARDAGVLQTLETMNSEGLEGYQEWEEDTDDDGNHSPMPPELARRVLQHAAGFQTELDALAEAARRPGCRIESSGNWLALLNQPARLLGASCHAAAALGEGPALTRGIETLLQAGNHLRLSNQTLGVVVGCGFEGKAFDVIKSLPDPAGFSDVDRSAWLAALELHTRSPEDEFAASSRLERGKFLKILDQFERNRSLPIGQGLARYGSFRRVYLARARLAACEALQGMVLAEGGKPAPYIDRTRIRNFQSYLHEKEPKPRRSAAEEFGLMSQTPALGIYEAIGFHEESRGAARQKLRIPSP